MRKRFHGPWFGNDAERARFEWEARARRLRFQCRRTSRGILYTVPVTLTPFDDRVARITFEKKRPRLPLVNADGPTDSKHRYADDRLCMWHPADPPSARWVLRDGLGSLIDHIAFHLYKEAYWREYGEWLGLEATHEPETAA